MDGMNAPHQQAHGLAPHPYRFVHGSYSLPPQPITKKGKQNIKICYDGSKIAYYAENLMMHALVKENLATIKQK
jgi:hypothetical protein